MADDKFDASKITREKTKEIALELENKKKWRGMQLILKSREAHDWDVNNAISEDEIYAKYGIEKNELNAAIIHYKLMEDIEIEKNKELMVE